MTKSLTRGVTMEWLMEDAIRPGAGLSLARMSVDPGVTGDAHRHPNCSEAVHLISGEVEQRAGTTGWPCAPATRFSSRPAACTRPATTEPSGRC